MSVAVWDWNTALRDCACGLSLTTKGMGWLLATYADNDTGRGIWPARGRLARQAGMTRASKVDPHLNRLTDAGWLARTGLGPSGVNVYCLTVPADHVAGCPKWGTVQPLPQMGPALPQMGQALPQMGALTSHRPSDRTSPLGEVTTTSYERQPARADAPYGVPEWGQDEPPF